MNSENAVNLSFIRKARFKHTLPKNKGSQVVFVKKLTHLHMQERGINSIGDLSVCKNLTVLYLHNNLIEKIENLQTLVNLSDLYLQSNTIRKIENFEKLAKLKKLNLSRNEINVVEGLNNLMNLEELYLEKQNLRNGDSLCFDPRSIHAIARTLQILNISNNNITSISVLCPLVFIKTFEAANNKLNDIGDVCETLKGWYYLREATLSGNPICKRHRYKENVIASTRGLCVLDGKSIADVTRCFIQRFEYEKIMQKSKSNYSLPKNLTDISKSYSLPIQQAVSASILKDARNSFDDSNLYDTETYIPWNALPTTKLPHKLKKTNRKEIVSKKQSITFNPFL